MPESLGTETKSIIIAEFKGLHYEFEVGATAVKLGQPVKLDANAKIVPLAAGDNEKLCIGISIHTSAVGAKATVAMKARGITEALAGAAINPIAPVKYSAFDSVTGKCKYVNIGGGEEALTTGWALEVAAALDDEVKIAIL